MDENIKNTGADESADIPDLATPRKTSGARGSKALWVVLCISVVIGIGAAVAAVLALSKIRTVEDDLRKSEAKVRSLSYELDNTTSELSRSIDDLTGPYGELSDLSDQITDAQSELSGDIFWLRTCVNEYMDTIAEAGGRRYTYSHC
jgi:hypothetical protein